MSAPSPYRVEAIVHEECTCTLGYLDEGPETIVDGDENCVIHGCSPYALRSERSREVADLLAEADRIDRGVAS